MRLLVIMLSVLVLVGSAGDGEAKKRKNRRDSPSVVVVMDYSTASIWQESIEQTIQSFNAVGGVQLRYVRGIEGECPSQKDKTVLALCSVPHLACFHHDGCPAHTEWTRRVVIRLADDAGQRQGWAMHKRRWICHEFMHALTSVPDNYNALPESSCVWGNLDTPGEFDISLLSEFR